MPIVFGRFFVFCFTLSTGVVYFFIQTRQWLFIFVAFITLITLNFIYAMANIWMYDDKSIFLQKASIALLFDAVIYVFMNMTVMFFPHILYGLPIYSQKRIDFWIQI